MSLSKQLLNKQTRPAVVKDLVEVVRQEVAAKKGVSGTAIKAGYAGATKMMPDLVRRGVRKLLPDFARALDPFWDDFVASGSQDFGQHLAARGPEASAALLAVTDAKLESSSRDQLKKVYRALRGKADGHVQAALPRLGAALQRHASQA
ncbi:DUF6918 family protein [Nocardioides antri]|uniref:Uncharacterized protein n=1 Tax=Nocardioides antri TaxID=2607659 RepID=A0A5B1M977_9ACTN|nr:hypothetical protein [Nocardioides antri]KAA1429383.1 hypothetical protein F0U47_04145 [Nocardioides antri]